jgi:Sulfotransferase domain
MLKNPRVILCLGLKSSGSTWLYNVAIRILKEARPAKGKVAAFFADNSTMLPDGAAKAQVLVIKSHEPSKAILFLTRFSQGKVLISVREPRDSVASLMQRFGHSFESALRDVRVGAQHVVALSRGKDTMTLRYEDGFADDERTVGEVARFLGVRLSKAARTRIFRSLTREAVRKKIDKLHKGETDPNAFDFTTQWHPGHVGDGRVGKFKAVLTAAQQKKIETATKDYARAFGYLRMRKR